MIGGGIKDYKKNFMRRIKMIKKYRKKPVIISAMQWLGDYDEISTIKSKIIPMGTKIKINIRPSIPIIMFVISLNFITFL